MENSATLKHGLSGKGFVDEVERKKLMFRCEAKTLIVLVVMLRCGWRFVPRYPQKEKVYICPQGPLFN